MVPTGIMPLGLTPSPNADTASTNVLAKYRKPQIGAEVPKHLQDSANQPIRPLPRRGLVNYRSL